MESFTPTIDYPGVRVDPQLVARRENILANVRVPARLHFGTMGLAPSEADYRQLGAALLHRRQH